MSKKVKIFAIVVASLAIVIFLASTFGGKKDTVTPPNNSPLSSTTGSVPLPIGPGNFQSSSSADEFSTLLSSIKRINIDTSIFENPAYKMLRDYPVSLGSDIVGRVNPFAPIGTDIGVGGSTSEVSIDTLQSGKVTSSTAEFGAQVSLPDTVPISIIFEYGISDNFGSSTTPLVVAKNGITLVTATGLIPQTTYYVRAVAVRGSLTTTGNTTTFTTTKK